MIAHEGLGLLVVDPTNWWKKALILSFRSCHLLVDGPGAPCVKWHCISLIYSEHDCTPKNRVLTPTSLCSWEHWVMFRFSIAAINTCHEFGALKQHKFIIAEFCRSEVWHGSHVAHVKLPARLHSFSRLRIISCLASSRCWQNSVPWGAGLRFPRAGWLSADSCCQHLEVPVYPPSKPAIVG